MTDHRTSFPAVDRAARGAARTAARITLLGMICAVLLRVPAMDATAIAQESNVLPALPGTAWHTLDAGGALFFVISGVGVRFGSDGSFTATVRFIDDQRTRKTGTYAVDGEGYLKLDIDGYPKQRVRVWTDGKDIMVRDEAHDVTARLVPGAMTDTSWF